MKAKKEKKCFQEKQIWNLEVAVGLKTDESRFLSWSFAFACGYPYCKAIANKHVILYLSVFEVDSENLTFYKHQGKKEPYVALQCIKLYSQSPLNRITE